VRVLLNKSGLPPILPHHKISQYPGGPTRIPVNFTIDRAGRLIDNGWKDKQPTWTLERLERIITPLLSGPT
jgi:hypothetical protein